MPNAAARRDGERRRKTPPKPAMRSSTMRSQRLATVHGSCAIDPAAGSGKTTSIASTATDFCSQLGAVGVEGIGVRAASLFSAGPRPSATLTGALDSCKRGRSIARRRMR
jgi:hypothetical protein